MAYRYCVQCGHALEENDKFCAACGRAVEVSAPAEPVTAPAGAEVPPQYTAVPPQAQAYTYTPQQPLQPPHSVPTGCCPRCGQNVHPQATVCVYCGQPLKAAGSKSKLVAGLLGIFLGSLGVHNFYLGYTGKAVAQLLLTLLGCLLVLPVLAAEIWGLVEGIMILTGSIAVDGQGRPLAE